MGLLHPDIGERLRGLQLTGPGSLSRPSLAWEHDPDTGMMHRSVQGEFSFVSNGVEVGRVTADGVLLPLLTATRVLFVGTGGTLDDDAGMTYAEATDILTLVGGLVSPTAGPASTQQHTLPAVTSDTVALLAATQTLTGKTLTGNVAVNLVSGAATVTLPTTTSTLATLALSETLTNKTFNLTSNTLVATSLQLLTALTDETGTGAAVFNASPTFTGVIANALGTSALPSYTFTGDLNTGISAATADQLILSVAGGVALTLSTAAAGPHAMGGATRGDTQLHITGSPSLTPSAFAILLTSILAPSADNRAAGIAVSMTINKAGSGTHADFSVIEAQPPTIGAGASALTNASTIKITDAPTGATNNYALWVDAGAIRLDATTANGTVATVMSSLGPVGSNTTIQEWLTININGTVRYIPCF